MVVAQRSQHTQSFDRSAVHAFQAVLHILQHRLREMAFVQDDLVQVNIAKLLAHAPQAAQRSGFALGEVHQALQGARAQLDARLLEEAPGGDLVEQQLFFADPCSRSGGGVQRQRGSSGQHHLQVARQVRQEVLAEQAQAGQRAAQQVGVLQHQGDWRLDGAADAGCQPAE